MSFCDELAKFGEDIITTSSGSILDVCIYHGSKNLFLGDRDEVHFDSVSVVRSILRFIL